MPAPAPAALPAAKPEGVSREEFEQFTKKFHASESEWGRKVAQLTRERDSFKAVEALPEDAKERLADLAESREELAEKAGINPELIPLADYKTMKARTAMLQEAVAARTSALAAELKAMEARVGGAAAPSPLPDRVSPSAQGTGSGEAVTKDNIDALYVKNPEKYGEAYAKFRASGWTSVEG